MGRGGYLEELEQQARAFGVEGVVGDAPGDVGEGDLDGAQVAEDGETERDRAGGGAGAASGWARGVMMETKLLAAEREAAAAVAGGMEVGAAGLRIGGSGTGVHEKTPFGINGKRPGGIRRAFLFNSTTLMLTNRAKLKCHSAGFLMALVLWIVDGFCTGEGY
jgi:hypothetical protein